MQYEHNRKSNLFVPTATHNNNKGIIYYKTSNASLHLPPVPTYPVIVQRNAILLHLPQSWGRHGPYLQKGHSLEK